MSRASAVSSTITDLPLTAAKTVVHDGDRLSLGVCLGYGVGTVGVSIMLNAVTTYFPALMTTVLGQSPEIAGYLLMVSKLYDAVMDIAIGAASDRTRSRWGRRRPFLLIGSLVSAASFLMIFSPPVMTDGWLAAYMLAALVLYSTGYSLFNVPYIAMPSEMTSDFNERTRLWSIRTLFISLGQLLSLAGTAKLIEWGGSGARGYQIMGIVLTLVIVSTMLGAFFGTARAPRIERSTGPKLPVSQQLRLVLANQHFMLLMGAKIFQFLAFASSAGTTLLFLLNVLKVGYGGQIELAIAQNVTTALAMPVWVRIAKKIGKKYTYLTTVGFYLLATVSWLFTGQGISETSIVVRGIVGGFGAGGMILMSMSMLSDTMAFDRYNSGIHREGFYSSIVAILEKTGFAIGVAVTGAYLNWAHYVPTKQGALVIQPDSAITALYMGVAVIPAVFFTGNLFCIIWYNLTAATLKAAQDARLMKTA